MPSTASIARGLSSSLRAMKLPAALLTRTSRGPSAQIASTVLSTASASRTSQTWVSTLPPASPASLAAASRRTSARRPQMTSRAPSSRKRRPMEKPRPVPPPVIRMRLPWRRSAWNMLGALGAPALVQPLLPHGEELLAPLGAESGTILAGELGERAFEGVSQALDDADPVAVGAAQRLDHDLVDDAQLQQILRRQLQRLGRVLGHLGAAPQDGRAALRRDHRIDGMLQHQDAI